MYTRQTFYSEESEDMTESGAFDTVTYCDILILEYEDAHAPCMLGSQERSTSIKTPHQNSSRPLQLGNWSDRPQQQHYLAQITINPFQ